MKVLIVIGFLSSLSVAAYAQDGRDAEIFGERPAQTSPAAPSSGPATTSAATMDGKLSDHLQVGGRAEMRATASKTEDTKIGRGALDQLRQADIFFDARPNPDVRAFLRARFIEETGLKGVEQDIDEMWIKSDWDHAVFFTAGKQHVKWGSGHLWNPTDFTATQSKDPFDLFDRRLGQTMVKIHIPDEKRAFNYYAILEMSDAKRNDDIGGALRGEFAFLGHGELALSFASRRNEPEKLGLDLSSAIGPLDAFFEAAISKRETRTFYQGTLDPATNSLPTGFKDEKKTFSQVVGGLNETWKYNDDDNITAGAEYFQNGLGYDDRNLGIYSLVNGQSQSLYVGKRYVGAYVTLPSPGPWNDTAFYLNALRNISDQTAQARFTTTWTFYKEATLEVFVSRCFGDYGELCFRVPESYQVLAQSPLLPPAQQTALAALPSKRTIGQIGSSFSIAF